MTIKLILTHDVDRLGHAGQVVDVKDGYARNYLVPRKLAIRWTKGAQRQIDQMEAARRKHEITSIEDARVVRDTLQEAIVTVANKVGPNGRLFGAVSTRQIADSVKSELNQVIDPRKIVVDHPIKSTGDYTVKVNLHPEVPANLRVRVIAQ